MQRSNSLILRTENLKRHFGALKAINGVSIGICEGELTAIIGPNGAGKTTLFNLVTGKLSKTGGKVFFRGEEITHLPPHLITLKGIGRSFQITNIFRRLSALQNILITVMSRRGKTANFLSPIDGYRDELERAYDILEVVGLGNKAHHVAGTMSHGDQKHIELGMVLALEPDLLLLDEPTAGMSPKETAETVALIKKLSQNKSIIFTEHDMRVVFSISERIIVLHQGEIIADGDPYYVKEDKTVKSAYLGEVL